MRKTGVLLISVLQLQVIYKLISKFILAHKHHVPRSWILLVYFWLSSLMYFIALVIVPLSRSSPSCSLLENFLWNFGALLVPLFLPKYLPPTVEDGAVWSPFPFSQTTNLWSGDYESMSNSWSMVCHYDDSFLLHFSEDLSNIDNPYGELLR